jgi:hypothetical protein
MRTIQKNQQGFRWNGTHGLVLLVDDNDVQGKNKYAIKKHTKHQLDATMEAGLEI